MHRLRHRIADAEVFSEPYETQADLWTLLRRVCGYMGVPFESVSLELFEDNAPTTDERGMKSGAAGVYSMEQGIHLIWINRSQLQHPMNLVATMAHELGHAILLGQGHVSESDEDMEPLTDLITTFLGMGVLTANAVMHEHYETNGQYSSWSMGRQGYMSMQQHGYALAVVARMRSETNPRWAKSLRPDIRGFFEQSTRFLKNGGAVGGVTEVGNETSPKTSPETQDEDGNPDTSSDGAYPQCTFCGEEIPNELVDREQVGNRGKVQRLGVCQKCRESDLENQDEIAYEREFNESTSKVHVIYWWKFLAFLAFLVVLQVMSSFR